jgi:glycosyltransferase involved in cell wall biosynthesis
MNDVAVGTTVFMRTDRLRRLLESVPNTIGTVYVADVGETDERAVLYESAFPFELVVLDLPFDAGVSRGRRRVVEESTEPFLLMVDCDNEIPPDVSVLRAQLAERPAFGGVAGALVEPEYGRVWHGAGDFADHGDTLVKSARLERKEVEFVAGHPFVEFDFLPNATLFRRECLEAYCWDPAYVNHKEHTDFFLGHRERTDWRFAASPRVVFPHYPGGSEEYMAYRYDDDRFAEQMAHFREKWGYDAVESPHGNWYDSHKVTDPAMGPRDLAAALPMPAERILADVRPPLSTRLRRVYRDEGLAGLLKRLLDRLRP